MAKKQTYQQRVESYIAKHGGTKGAAMKALRISTGAYYGEMWRAKNNAVKKQKVAGKKKKRKSHPHAEAFADLIQTTPARSRKVSAVVVFGDPADVAATLAQLQEKNQ